MFGKKNALRRDQPQRSSIDNNNRKKKLILGFLVGDINNSGSVNSSDISGVQARSDQSVDATNFKYDVNVSGAINSSDISAVKARSGLVLPN